MNNVRDKKQKGPGQSRTGQSHERAEPHFCLYNSKSIANPEALEIIAIFFLP